MRRMPDRLLHRMAAFTGAAILAALISFGLWQLGHGLYMTAKAQLAFFLIDRAWAQTLADGQPHKAWAWADAWPVAEIEVPRLGTREVVLSNASGQALAFAPGLVAGSAAPGSKALSVFAAHRDSHFAFLKSVRIGDEITLRTSANKLFHYKITSTRVVDAKNSGIDPRQEQGIALTTCYPFGAITHGPLRFVVRADEFFSPSFKAGDITALSVNKGQVIE